MTEYKPTLFTSLKLADTHIEEILNLAVEHSERHNENCLELRSYDRQTFDLNEIHLCVLERQNLQDNSQTLM